jgi:glycosyltransferase involved in cell wall biosynthesis
MSNAIYYTSTRNETGFEKQIFGLNVAIRDLLKAYFKFSTCEQFSFLLGHSLELEDIEQLCAETGVARERLKIMDRRHLLSEHPSIDCVFRPEPGTRQMLWLRQHMPSFAFCGLAHAISGSEGGDVLQEYCLAPAESYDAIICPSHALKSTIASFWDCYGDFINTRFGAHYRCPVQLPVIPLGVDIEKFEAYGDLSKRKDQRSQLGVEDDALVILWVGRLSATIKAHPLAMFKATNIAALKNAKPVHFILVGYFVPENAADCFVGLARDVCSKVKVTFIDAHDPRFPYGLWAAADIFLSLIDNLQESFGLTPLEAMAAGLPRVLSDWDGYRDSVKDGEDGYLIRTMQPPPGQGFELTARVASGLDSYGGFLGRAALTVAVNVEQAAERL